MWSSRRFLAVFTLTLTSACASLGGGRPLSAPRTDYEAYVGERLVQGRLFDRGREMLVAKALVADANLKAEQEKVTPGHSLELRPGERQIILAVSVAGRDELVGEDLKLFLSGQPATSIVEIPNQTVIEVLYPFAFPFHRVFLVTFPGATSWGALQVQSPAGSVELTISGGEAGHG